MWQILIRTEHQSLESKMNKLKSFFMGIILLAITFAMVFMTVLIYRASNQASVKTYIFQMDNSPKYRVGPLEDMKRPNVLRNKLIQKYVAEYFKVMPIENNIVQQQSVYALSDKDVYKQWSDGVAKQIQDMAKHKILRTVYVDVNQIRQTDEPGWFVVPYTTRTWMESNNMAVSGKSDGGVVILKIRFEPGFKPNINVKKSLEKGDNPAILFKFKVEAVKEN